ncbi:DNA-binding LytR/AlgR family response regulator [Chitinophaga dinghuensis]|uniref:DNA-binding LytR/AlgR family response regulator n=1 Tax=Chitinophaga dinghuensis TaxID=1539050 RepID=A0A327W1W0_9BACT|nr:LytTR family DNA-binding domain-containing protein [Chitinophaga dinghuensis]RAJ82266.1 DNA-binding LytR/AlgR family response regulator [Chitinophaga dinghuensis]
MLNCLIIDDEPLARKQIENYVEQVPFLHLVGTARNPVIGQAILETEAVDLIFLDIKMPHQTGIEFIRQHHPLQQIILITAFPEYAVEGFELSVTDYLMKPVTFERFYKACEKAQAKVSGNGAVRSNIEQPGSLYVKCNQRFEKILLQDIQYVEARLNYVHIITSYKKYMVYSSLTGIEGSLPPERFIRIHKSYIVSTDHLTAVEGHQVYIGEIAIPVGRSYKQSLLQHPFLRKGSS